MAVLKLHRRRLGQLLLVSGLLLSGSLLWSAQDGAGSLDDQLESARWRDSDVSSPPTEEESREMPPQSHTVPVDCAEWLQAGVIFTKADRHPRMKPKLMHMLKSLSSRTEKCVNFNMFTDDRSRSVIDSVFRKAQLPSRFKVR